MSNVVKRVIKPVALVLLPLALLVCGGLIYFLFNPIHPQGDPYARLNQRRAISHPLTYQGGDVLQLAYKTGSYTDEPVYADLIRTALKLGYHVFPYEVRDEQIAVGRERAQAMNLYESVFRNNPDARLIVHVGHGHHNENPTAMMLLHSSWTEQ